METLSFRPNVAALIRHKSGKILIAERVGQKGAWQFPQGGVDEGEESLGALFREVEEEVGISKDTLEVRESRGGYRYQFPDGRMKFGKFHGQEQTYFLCDYSGKKKAVDLGDKKAEFSDFRWIKPEKFLLEWVPKFKREVYKEVFRDFFAIDLGAEIS